jgi:dinuclear metal center YbgI/SA1388 family protein
MLVSEVLELLEAVAPPALAAEWDNVGLQVGNRSSETNGCLLSLDVLPQTIGEARNCGASLVIAHHPLIFEPLRSVTEGTVTGQTVLSAARTGVAVYVAHTNLDSAPQLSTATALAERLGLPPGPPLVTAGLPAPAHVSLEGPPGQGGEAPEDTAAIRLPGLGMVCEVPEMTLGAFAQYVAPRLGRRETAWVGEADRLIRSVVLLPGSGGGMVQIAAGVADVLLTGEIKYHEARHAADLGLGVIVGGHYETERPVLNHLARLLKNRLGTLQVSISQLRTDPFQTGLE